MRSIRRGGEVEFLSKNVQFPNQVQTVKPMAVQSSRVGMASLKYQDDTSFT